MRSQTQRALSPDEVADLVRHSLGSSCRVENAAEMDGGGFAAVWRVDLDDGRAVVLKTSPPATAELLTYERDLLAAEADYFRLAGRKATGVPVPEVLYYGAGQPGWEGDLLIMTLLPGTPLSWLHEHVPQADDAPVRFQLGQAMARVHSVKGTEFGYVGVGRRGGRSWRTVFLDVIADLLADAARLSSALPVEPRAIFQSFNAASAVLDDIRTPTLVHFDMWDGNVLAADDAGGFSGPLHLSGLVDGERHLYADPLVDFVSVDLFGTIETQPEHPFVRGYGAELGRPLTWGADEMTRIRLYRAWLYLVMTVEIPTRALSGDLYAEHRRFRAKILQDALAALAARA